MHNRFAQTLNELLAGVMVAALGIYIIVEAQGFPILPGNDYGAALFPKIVGYGMALGGSWLALKAIRPLIELWQHRQTESMKMRLQRAYRLLLPVLLVIAYILLADTLGAILTLVLIVTVLMIISGVQPVVAVLIALVTAAVIWFAFVYSLKVPLPLGVFVG